jgi:hypothetical protein
LGELLHNLGEQKSAPGLSCSTMSTDHTVPRKKELPVTYHRPPAQVSVRLRSSWPKCAPATLRTADPGPAGARVCGDHSPSLAPCSSCLAASARCASKARPLGAGPLWLLRATPVTCGIGIHTITGVIRISLLQFPPPFALALSPPLWKLRPFLSRACAPPLSAYVRRSAYVCHAHGLDKKGLHRPHRFAELVLYSTACPGS